MMDIQTLFTLGMKRDLPPLYTAEGTALNLGAGLSEIPGAVNIDWPEWDANRQPIPAADGEIATIHAYHFLEHVEDPIRMLREIQRVLRVGGVANLCVPHYLGSMAYHDLTHKTIFAADSYSNLLCPILYTKDRDGWRLRIHFNVIIGIVERNLCVLTQLVKE